jgi:uncharacterized protein YjbJ (UPF0337 family)
VLDQQTKTQLQTKFEQIKPQLKQQFSGITDQDLDQASTDPDMLVETIEQKTGQPRTQIEQRLKSLVTSS